MGDQYDRALDSQYQLGKDGSFEFRLKQFHLHHNLDNVFVMSLKQGKWVARYFDRNNGIHDGLVFTERAVDQAPVNQLWKLLVDKRVLTLPSQGKIANRLVGYKVDTANLPYGYTTHLEVIDGVEYEFSLHAPTGHRHYSYYSPQAYLNKFSNVEELFDAVMLIALVKKFLGLPLKVN